MREETYKSLFVMLFSRILSCMRYCAHGTHFQSRCLLCTPVTCNVLGGFMLDECEYLDLGSSLIIDSL